MMYRLHKTATSPFPLQRGRIITLKPTSNLDFRLILPYNANSRELVVFAANRAMVVHGLVQAIGFAPVAARHPVRTPANPVHMTQWPLTGILALLVA